jgi:putative transposase
MSKSKSRLPLEPDTTYHLFMHAVQDSNLFVSKENYDYFLNRWKKLSSPYFITYGYCLMPNHLHLCVKTAKLDTIASVKNPKNFFSKKVSNVLSSYAQSFNKLYGKKGALFRERFGRIIVMDDVYKRNLICYINHNPLHHFGYENYEDYQRSSYNTILHYSLLSDFEMSNEVITAQAYIELMELFNNKQGFQQYHQVYKTEKSYRLIEAEMQAILEKAVNKNSRK